MVHRLKCAQGYFRAVKAGVKPFEVRFDDRGFKVGDTLVLQEWSGKHYTGEEYAVKVGYILRAPEYCKQGYCIMGIAPEKSGSVQERMEQVKQCLTEEDKQRPGMQWMLLELERAYERLEKEQARR
ncbi:MAG: DUF3850 domain-containing protein [Ethanoligenens sp.]